MSLTIETELKEVLEGLNRRFDKIDQKLDNVQNDITELKIGQSEIKGEIKTINTRIDGLEDKISTGLNGLDDKIKITQQSVDRLSTDVATVSKEISDLKGVKSLIVPAFVAIFASLITLLARGIKLP